MFQSNWVLVPRVQVDGFTCDQALAVEADHPWAIKYWSTFMLEYERNVMFQFFFQICNRWGSLVVTFHEHHAFTLL